MSDQPCAAGARIYSIGHSNHSADAFLGLLRQHGIEVVVDVRSQPFSRYTPHFTTGPLRESLAAAGVRYLFLGRELGGRPEGDEYYDAEGHARYDLVAASAPFLEGITRLLRGIEQFRVAMLCAEEDPTHCHRRLLVGRVLEERGVAILHIRGDGRVESEDAVRAAEEQGTGSGQLALFEAPRTPQPWRSVQAIRPARS
jgi:uncharacterized protein (DUF488 family)